MVFYTFTLLMLLGSVMVFYSLSPYFAALGLVISTAFGCILLGFCGVSFLAILLLLIYLGGMMVVFVYANALSADRFPVISNVGEVFFLFMVIFFWVYMIFEDFMDLGALDGSLIYLGDLSSLSVLYDYGYLYLLVGGIALLVVLVLVLIISFSFSYTCLRAL
uniref:NADH-ubiquinone oxidoreductase chain 6 n=1 Tax=Phyllophorella liuwutiensis TaxID=2810320 RepID=A0A890VVU1_9ECHN|nr:NADH dehydrogenase subunit 6 [Phyllophorella liuwutiensis]QRI59071.1 NADH dehydrogenase subunit 6 [Phyllophorella liuwutiensis]